MVNASPRPLDPRVKLGVRFIGGWVGQRASLDVCGKSRQHRNSISGPSSPWQLTVQTTLSWPILRRSTEGILYEFTAFGMIQKANVILGYCGCGLRNVLHSEMKHDGLRTGVFPS
jgi:hypothetical protein